MTTKISNYLRNKITWREGTDPLYPYVANFGGEKYTVRLNDFPDEHLYTLIVNGVEIADFSDCPGQWMRPHEDPHELEAAKSESADELLQSLDDYDEVVNAF